MRRAKSTGGADGNSYREAAPRRGMRNESRSRCPLNLTLEMLGDRWSLLVIRDVMFCNHRHYGDLQRLSAEGIASNILADRLNRLVKVGLLSRTEDPTHKQKAIYSLTEASIQLVPLIAQMIMWGRKHAPGRKELTTLGNLIGQGDERVCNAFMDELRVIHLGVPARRRSAFSRRLAALASAAGERNQVVQ